MQRHEVRQSASSRPRIPITKEVLIGITVFVGIVAIAIMTRGITRQQPESITRSAVVGSSAGEHQAIDAGNGGVIASAEHDRTASTATNAVFSLSLNTHTVDLNDFVPEQQVKLHAGTDRGTVPELVQVKGDESSHHQNYILTFPAPPSNKLSLSVHNVAGVGERRLPFTL